MQKPDLVGMASAFELIVVVVADDLLLIFIGAREYFEACRLYVFCMRLENT